MTINVTSTGFSLKGGNGSSTPQTASPVTIKLKTGTQVTGQLVKSDGSTGVSSAWISFWDPSANTSGGGVSTDGSGEFSVVLSSGSYNVDLYIPSNVGEATPAGMTINVTSTGFSLKGGNGSSTPQTASPVTIKLKTGTQVTGQLVKSDGSTGVSSAWISFWDPSANTSGGGVSTDGSGEFSVVLSSGSYNVDLYIPSNVGEATPAGMTINVTSTGFSLKGGNGSSTPQTASPVTIKLKTGTQVTGQLVKSDGSTGVSSAWISFWDPSANTSGGGVSTDGSGEFSVVLSSGSYNVDLYIPSDVGEATPAGMTINVTSTGFSLKGGNGSSTPQTASPVTIKLKTGTQVTGQLVKSDGSTGVSSAWISFWDPSANTSGGGVSTDGSGEFSVVLSSGSYNVDLYIPSDVGEATPAGMTINVTSTGFSLKGGNGSSTPQTASPVTIKLKTGTQVTGQLVKSDGSTGVSSAWISFWDPSANTSGGGVSTDGSGEFSVVLSSGSYNVDLYIPSNVGEATPAGMTINVTSTGFSLKGGNGSSTPQTASPVTIKLKTGTQVTGQLVKSDGSTGVSSAWISFGTPVPIPQAAVFRPTEAVSLALSCRVGAITLIYIYRLMWVRRRPQA